jgi:hypothetical protein
VFDDEVFDELFSELVVANDEGVARPGDAAGELRVAGAGVDRRGGRR